MAGPLLLLFFALVYGSIGYLILGGYSPVDALFMTVITVTTVGYGEVRPLSTVGEIFTLSVIGLGVLGFLYTFGLMVEALAGDRWPQYRRVRRMQRTITALHGHVIICGYGRTGKQVVSGLRTTGENYVIIEKDPAPLAELATDGEPHIIGDAASDDVLRAAGIERARALVSAVDSDERAVYITLSARSLNPKVFVVARASYPESEPKLSRAGADRVVSPYRLSGRRMAALVTHPAVVDAIDVVVGSGPSGISVEELQVGRQGDVAVLAQSSATLLALRRQDGRMVVAPSAGESISPGDLVIAMGTAAQLAALANLATAP